MMFCVCKLLFYEQTYPVLVSGYDDFLCLAVNSQVLE